MGLLWQWKCTLLRPVETYSLEQRPPISSPDLSTDDRPDPSLVEQQYVPVCGVIFIKLINDKTMSVVLDLDQPLLWLRLHIYDRQAYDPETMILKLSTDASCRKLVHNDMSLVDLGVQFGDWITVSFPIDGGVKLPMTPEEAQEKMKVMQRQLDTLQAKSDLDREKRKDLESKLEEERARRKDAESKRRKAESILNEDRRSSASRDRGGGNAEIKAMLEKWRSETAAQAAADRIKLQDQLDTLNTKYDALQNELTNLGKRSRTGPVQQYAKPNRTVDDLRDTASRQRTQSTITAYVEALGKTGVRAVGKYLNDELGRYDVPVVMLMSHDKLDSLQPDQWKPIVIKFLQARDVALPATRRLQQTYKDLYPGSTNVPNDRDNTRDMDTTGLRRTPREKELASSILAEVSKMTGATTAYDGRRQMMNLHSYQHPNQISNTATMSEARALTICEDFLTGKKKTPPSLQVIRRACAPGGGPFNVKSTSHFSTALMGLNQLISRLQAKGVTIPNADSITRQLFHANTLITTIPEGRNLSKCIEAWSTDLMGTGSFAGPGFVYETRSEAAKNDPKPSYNYKGARTKTGVRCDSCKQQGHTRRNCPYRNGRPVPQTMICTKFNDGVCDDGRNCSLMHVCMKCRVASAWHPSIRCEATQ